MKTRKRRKVQTNKAKANYVSEVAFVDLKKSMEDALAFERGKRRNLKVTRIQAPPPAKDNVV
jgi:hypothetical protein